jgi:hypothetical protein
VPIGRGVSLKQRINPIGKLDGWKKFLNALTIHFGTASRPPTNHDRHARFHDESDSPRARLVDRDDRDRRLPS